MAKIMYYIDLLKKHQAQNHEKKNITTKSTQCIKVECPLFELRIP